MDQIINVFSVLGVLAGCAGFYEWRIRAMYTQLHEKIKDKEALNKVIQAELKDDIHRLESKIDMLIQLQIQGAGNDKRNQI